MKYYYVSFKNRAGREVFGLWRYAESPERAIYLADAFCSVVYPTKYSPDLIAVVERESLTAGISL